MILEFERSLIRQEKSDNTVKKYIRDVKKFVVFLNKTNEGKDYLDDITIEECIDFKKKLMEVYSPVSVNSMIASINCFLIFIHKEACLLKTLKIQKKMFEEESRCLEKYEYERLVQYARNSGQEKMALVMETICSTGIRISELQYFTVEGVKNGRIYVFNKGKSRTVFVPHKLKLKLLAYIKKSRIQKGSIFVTKNHKTMNRSNIWKMMKRIAKDSGVMLSKVYPHNLRHLFGKIYYQCHKDIVKLADILGHNNIETTRIYTMDSVREHERQINQLDLVLV